GNNIHIESDNILATGESIKNGNLITVKDLSNPPNIISDLYTSVSYAYDYMGINESIQISNPGTTNLDLHNSLFEQSFTSNVPNPSYIDSINGKDIKFCGQQSSKCKTIKYAIDRNPTPLSGIPPPDINYTIIMTSNTELDTNIQINSTSLNIGYVIIQSYGYSPETDEDTYNKQSISTSSFSNSLFTISETGDLSLLGLHFDNLKPSSTNPLISLRTNDLNKIPIFSINQIKTISATFPNEQQYGTGIGAAINANLQTGSQLLIKDSEFIQCKGSNYGGAIYLYINNGGQATVSNSSFDQCESTNGGGIYASIMTSGKLTIDGYNNFTECKAVDEGGGDGVKFEDCTSTWGGGILISVYGGKTNILNQCLFTECKSISGNGGGICSDLIDGTVIIENITFDSCTCTQPGNGGALYLYQGISSIISIVNSSFINCQSISSPSNQRYGWGGAIFIQTSVIASNFNESNFLLRNLIFSGCSAVNSIGNNLHIQSFDTYTTGEAIENNNLLIVNGTINLYYNNSYQQDYMGIDESKVGDGTIINNNIPLFSFHALKTCIQYNNPQGCSCPIDDSNQYTKTQCEEDNAYYSLQNCKEEDVESVQANTCKCKGIISPSGCMCPRESSNLIDIPIDRCQCVDNDVRAGISCAITS
ncbi:MAG: hypothetical protein EZS28_037992, partial [Streblomastix strix]